MPRNSEDDEELLEQAAKHIEDVRELTAGFEKAHRKLDTEYKKLLDALGHKLQGCEELVAKLLAKLKKYGE